jgi:hypothetical protein
MDLLIVFSVTCICVVAGTPFVSNYAVRARMVEAIILADSARSAITLACMEEPGLDGLNERAVGFTFRQTQYASNVRLEGSCRKATVTLQTSNTGASPDPIITFTGVMGADGYGMDWSCSSTARNPHLPEGCRK